MADSDDVKRVWKIMERNQTCMLVTRDGASIRARPMAGYPDSADGAVYFLIDERQHKDDEIAADPHVCLVYIDKSADDFLSVSGRAEVSNDRNLIKSLWTLGAQAWLKSPDNSDIRVLKVIPADAEYWNDPGAIVSAVKVAAAAASGETPDLGKNRKVSMSPQPQLH